METTGQNTKRLGPLQKRMLVFAMKYANRGWFSYANDPTTRRVIKSLVKRGLIKINDYRQFRLLA